MHGILQNDNSIFKTFVVSQLCYSWRTTDNFLSTVNVTPSTANPPNNYLLLLNNLPSFRCNKLPFPVDAELAIAHNSKHQSSTPLRSERVTTIPRRSQRATENTRGAVASSKEFFAG